MPVVRTADAVTHDLHGVRFVSYASPAHGSGELCAWRGEIPAGTTGPAHTISREEVFLLLDGVLALTIDGEPHDLVPGDVAIAPAGSTLGVTNPGPQTAAMWVTTSVGLEGILEDGTRIRPPWAN